MSVEAKNAFGALGSQFQCPGATVLISEEQEPSNLLILLDGKVKISMNSFDGRRFLLGIAGVGDMLGLTSVVSGIRSEIRAEAMYPCTFASLRRQDFLDFLMRHPGVWKNVGRELGLHYAQTCERLRMFGLTSSAKSRLASLLLEWCRGGRQTASGIQAWCVLTHGEIGECIGTSRETVTRNLTDFKSNGVAELRGTILTVPSRVALASYAALESIPDWQGPTVA
jgi:CRP/FNR family transcriptional regulator